MLEFVAKQTVFDYLDLLSKPAGEIGLLDIQRAGVAAAARGFEMSRIGVIAGSGLEVNQLFRDDNEFYDVELPSDGPSVRPANGVGLNPSGTAETVNVLLSCGQFDSVGNEALADRLDAMFALLAPRGVMIHSMQFYLEDNPSGYWKKRLAILSRFADGVRWTFLSPNRASDLTFSTRLASISDSAMYQLFKSSNVMKQLRTTAQGVGLVFAFRRLD